MFPSFSFYASSPFHLFHLSCVFVTLRLVLVFLFIFLHIALELSIRFFSLYKGTCTNTHPAIPIFRTWTLISFLLLLSLFLSRSSISIMLWSSSIHIHIHISLTLHPCFYVFHTYICSISYLLELNDIYTRMVFQISCKFLRTMAGLVLYPNFRTFGVVYTFLNVQTFKLKT